MPSVSKYGFLLLFDHIGEKVRPKLSESNSKRDHVLGLIETDIWFRGRDEGFQISL